MIFKINIKGVLGIFSCEVDEILKERKYWRREEMNRVENFVVWVCLVIQRKKKKENRKQWITFAALS